MRIIWQTVRRITNEILGVKGLIPSHHSHTGCKIQEYVPPCTKKGWAKINLWADCYDSILRKTTKTERHKYQNDQFITIILVEKPCKHLKHIAIQRTHSYFHKFYHSKHLHHLIKNRHPISCKISSLHECYSWSALFFRHCVCSHHSNDSHSYKETNCTSIDHKSVWKEFILIWLTLIFPWVTKI